LPAQAYQARLTNTARGPDTNELASALRLSIGLLLRRLRQIPTGDELTLSESAALARLDRGGSATAAELARAEQISPQSMGATLAALQERGLIAKVADPADGRRMILSITPSGLEVLRHRRTQRTEQLAKALSTAFTATELEQLATAAPLLERLANRI
jgi:DNA-binding MarR family transcriptional regulator